MAAPDQPRNDAAAPRRALPGRLVWVVWVSVAAAVLVVDQATKALAVLELADRIVDLGFMDLRLVRNPNAAFDVPGFPGMFLIIAVVVVTMIVRTLPTTERLSLAAGFGLLTGGAVGNAIDRVARFPGFPSGHVVDFFDLRWFPVFNIADSAIVCGAILLGLLMVRAEREERLSQVAAEPHTSVRPETGTPRRDGGTASPARVADAPTAEADAADGAAGGGPQAAGERRAVRRESGMPRR